MDKASSFDWEIADASHPYTLDAGQGAHLHGNPQTPLTSILEASGYAPQHAVLGEQNQAVPSVDYEDVESEQLLTTVDREVNQISQKLKSRHLDWTGHQTELKRLYMEENKTLLEIMSLMKERYGFEASRKMYLEKFKKWGWQKNLPAKVALFMTEKAKKRKRDTGSDTIFEFGGKVWTKNHAESTLKRARSDKRSKTKTGHDTSFNDVSTPDGVAYTTPPSNSNSPDPGMPSNSDSGTDSDMFGSAQGLGQEDSDVELVRETRSQEESSNDGLPLSWKGRTRKDLLKLWEAARHSNQEGQSQTAQIMFKQALDGLTHVSGPTNDDTLKVAYALADSYAQAGRSADADEVLERITRTHIEMWGYEHKKTGQHILHIIELLNGWNRCEDALGLLSLSEERLQQVGQLGVRPNSGVGRSKRRGKNKASMATTDQNQQPNLREIVNSIKRNGNPSTIDYGLVLAHAHIAAKDAAVEPLLQSLIQHCRGKMDQLAIQHLRATGELLNLYRELGTIGAHRAEFATARSDFNQIWGMFYFDEEKFDCFELMEAALQVATNMLKCRYLRDAVQIFRAVSDKASSCFGFSDERTVWMAISIGLVYQTHRSWDEALEWFEQAFSAALANKHWDSSDGILKSLQRALDRRHFVYITDEGRPFRTIFGVSGVVIRPARLHLE